MSAPDFPSQSSSKDLEDRLRNDAADVETTARHDIKEVGDELKHEANALAREARDQVEQVTEKAKGLAEEQKQALVNQLDGVSTSLDKVAGELEGKGESSAHYVRMVADGASRLTSTVRDNSVDDILAIAEEFGRKQPAAFMGVAALLGFAASRFVGASASRRAAENKPVESGDTPSEKSEVYAAETPTPSKQSYAQSVGGSDAGV